MSKVKGQGWFLETLGGLVTGDEKFLEKCDDVRVFPDAAQIIKTLEGAHDLRLSWKSRRGWWTINHPVIGIIQWKTGTDFRTVGAYAYLRVNGKLILEAWPVAGFKKTQVHWANKPQDSRADRIEERLGYIS